MTALDVITLGRASVDLYGVQVGGRLEDMRSFNKYLGGSPANIAVGAARLGLRSALITRVGDEHMGRYIREQLTAEGVCVDGVVTDPERLTALVLLGIRDKQQFPLIFYRADCADMALCEDDIDEDFIARAQCLTVTGTHLSHPQTEAAVIKALGLARKHGLKTVLDIDYRPNLWGLAGHDAGESRYIESRRVTEKLQATLHRFDLIVGTEEEWRIAGGNADTVAALRAARARSAAVLVCKQGAAGAALFQGEIPDTLDAGLTSPGFLVEPFNVLGAGDGFMSGLLRGWLRDESWPTALAYANAVGAIAVSRHGCAPAYPSWDELAWFLKYGSEHDALRQDELLEHIHWATTRLGDWPQMRVFAFDHRQQFKTMAAAVGAGPERIARFKQLCLTAVERVADGRPGYGLLCDAQFGSDTLHAAAGRGLWIGRPVEAPGSRPLALELDGDWGAALAQWPSEQVVKVLCAYHPDDDDDLQARQEATVMRLFQAVRGNGLECLVELVPSKAGPVDADATATVMRRFYEIGVWPDWWKLEPASDPVVWDNVVAVLEEFDPWCRGIIMLGLDAPEDELMACFAAAAKQPRVKGFAVGRTIFSAVAKAWLHGELDDGAAVDDMVRRYRNLCEHWDRARNMAHD